MEEAYLPAFLLGKGYRVSRDRPAAAAWNFSIAANAPVFTPVSEVDRDAI